MASPAACDRAVELIKALDPLWAERTWKGVPAFIVMVAMEAERERLAKLMEDTDDPLVTCLYGAAEWLRREGEK